MDSQQVLQTAQALASQGHFEQALGEYGKLLQQNPSDTRVLLQVGDLQARIRDFGGAIQTYSHAAGIYAQQDAALKAIAVYKQVRELVLQHFAAEADQFFHVVERLTELYAGLGLINDALRILDEEAMRLRNAERDDDALTVYRLMTDVGPNVPLPHLRLAEGLYRTGEVDESLRSFSSAASLLLATEQREDALRVLERMLHIKPEPKQAKLAARLYLERGTEAEGMQALSRLQICFQADPADLEILHMLSQAFDLIGHEDRAVEVQKEMARLAHEQGNAEVWGYALHQLRQRALDDEQVQALLEMPPPEARGSEMPLTRAATSAAESGPPSSRAPGSSRPPMTPPPKPARPSGGPPRLELVSSKPPPPALAPSLVPPPPPPLTLHSAAPPPSSVPHSSPPRSNPPPRPNRRLPPTRPSIPVPPVPTMPAPAPGTERESARITANPVSSKSSFKTLDDVLTNTRRVLADAQTYRNLSLFHKGIELLRAAAAIDPQSIELHEMLRDLYTDVGDRDGAIQEMLTMVDIYVEFERPDYALAVLLNVLDEEDTCEPATEMLRALIERQPDLQDELPERHLLLLAASARGAPSSSEAAASAPSAPRGSRPDDSDTSAAAPANHGPSPIPPPPPLVSSSRHPLPPPPPSQTNAAPPPRLSLEESLEEVEFFASRGMLGEAQRLIEAQLETHPGHPLLVDALEELEELEASSQAPRDLSDKLRAPRPATDSLDAGLQLSLAELEEAVRASQRPPAPGEQPKEVDIDEMFDKFKKSVRAQVAENDAATHYDLGLAYKDMALLDDAIEELELAAKDAEYECSSHTSIGTIYAEQGMWEKASKAFSRALSSVKKTPKQECTVYYHLGEAAEHTNQIDQALYYFRQVLRRDQQFRDARIRTEQLGKRRMQTPSGRPRAQDEEVDRAFEELLGE